MRQVYADNAATSYPKPKEVNQSMYNYIENIGSNIGRGSYGSAYNAVMRPLFSERLKGVEVTRIMCGIDGTMNSAMLEKNIKSFNQTISPINLKVGL